MSAEWAFEPKGEFERGAMVGIAYYHEVMVKKGFFDDQVFKNVKTEEIPGRVFAEVVATEGRK